MSESLWKLKKEACEVGRRIWLRGYCAGNEGNHSVRIGPDKVLCTPTGVSKGFLRPEMLCVVDMEGRQLDTSNAYKRTSEVLVHLGIYKKRPDVKAVIHSHPPHATAFAIAQIPLPEGIHPEAEVFLGRVPMAPYATPSTQALPDSITALITPETNTVLMGNHGSVTFSTRGLTDALYKLEILDAYCRILLLTHQLGRVNTLDPQQMAALLVVKQKFGLSDERLSCAAEGCVGAEQNQPFLASFDAGQPQAGACCDPCAGGRGEEAGGGEMDPAAFESLVQSITDQVMAAGDGR